MNCAKDRYAFQNYYLLAKSSDFLQKLVIIQKLKPPCSKREIRTPTSRLKKILFRPPKAKSVRFYQHLFAETQNWSKIAYTKTSVSTKNKNMQKQMQHDSAKRCLGLLISFSGLKNPHRPKVSVALQNIYHVVKKNPTKLREVCQDLAIPENTCIACIEIVLLPKRELLGCLQGAIFLEASPGWPPR